MSDFRKLLLAMMAVVLMAGSSPVSAATLTFYSHGTAANTPSSAWSSSAGPLLEITPNAAWYNLPGPPKWISPWNSGAQVSGYFSPPNGTMVAFTLDFLVPTNFVVSSATLNVVADDTTDAVLNGNQIFPHGAGQATHCVVTPPGCVESTVWSGAVNTAWFVPGANEMVFSPKQIYGYSYGMSASLEVVGDYREAVPEPTTIFLFVAGLSLFVIGKVAAKS